MTDTTPVSASRGWIEGAPIEAPLRLYDTTVLAEWVDYNEHMSESCYLLVAGNSSDQFFRYVGIDEAYRNAGRSLYTVETHIRFLREASLGEPLHLTFQVLAADSKRVHINHEIYRGAPGLEEPSELLATVEQLLLHIESTGPAPKVAAMPDGLYDRISQVSAAHASLGVPDYIGHVMGLQHR